MSDSKKKKKIEQNQNLTSLKKGPILFNQQKETPMECKH